MFLFYNSVGTEFGYDAKVQVNHNPILNKSLFKIIWFILSNTVSSSYTFNVVLHSRIHNNHINIILYNYT